MFMPASGFNCTRDTAVIAITPPQNLVFKPALRFYITEFCFVSASGFYIIEIFFVSASESYIIEICFVSASGFYS